MLTDNLNVIALALYARSRVTSTELSDLGRVEFTLELTPEAETLIEESRRGGLQVDFLRYVAAQEEMRGHVRRAKAKR